MGGYYLLLMAGRKSEAAIILGYFLALMITYAKECVYYWEELVLL